MIAAPDGPSDAVRSGTRIPALEGPLAQLATLVRALRRSDARRRIAWMTLGIVVVIAANAFGQIRLNLWQGDFYDALTRRDLGSFFHQLLVFLVIVGGLLVLVVSQTWLQEMLKVRLREWLTRDLLDEWLAPRRACLLTLAGQVGVNPDQRMHEDARRLTELSTELGVGLLQSSLLLLSFTGVLWVLSAQVVFVVGDTRFGVPGYMVWCALAYCAGGSWLAWRVGRPLIELNAERYGREAELRFGLVRVSEAADGVALYRGEVDERRRLQGALERVVDVTRRLARGLARLTWVTSGYGWLAIVAPILVAAPGYFSGDLSFGSLMIVVGAFFQVQQALRWFVDNFSRIADWRATLLRVVALRDALIGIERFDNGFGRIEIGPHPEGRLALQDLTLALPNGWVQLAEGTVEIAPAERVTIVGEAGSGKSTLFRAIAGVWPWGRGTILLPPGEQMMFLPQRPYLPPGTLRASVAYPARGEGFDETRLRAVLELVGLQHLESSLEREARWDQELPLDEQQRLAFARALLHRPRWLLLDDAMVALADDQRHMIYSLIERELPGTAVINVGRKATDGGFFARVLHLRRVSTRASSPPTPVDVAGHVAKPGGGAA